MCARGRSLPATGGRFALACHTQEQIAEAVGAAKSSVNEVCSEMATLPKLNKPDAAAADHATGATRPDMNCPFERTI